MFDERIEQVGHGDVESLGPLVEMANVFISDLGLVQSMSRHSPPLFWFSNYFTSVGPE